jgi:HSP20 family protein
MDRVFDQFSGAFAMPSLRRMFDWEPTVHYETSVGFATPSVEVAEDEKAYKITAELPGLESNDVEISMPGDMLVLKGEKRQESEKKDKNSYVSERAYGSFRRSFRLPDDIDRDKIAADLSKGVLTITLPKTAEAQSRRRESRSKPRRHSCRGIRRRAERPAVSFSAHVPQHLAASVARRHLQPSTKCNRCSHRATPPRFEAHSICGTRQHVLGNETSADCSWRIRPASEEQAYERPLPRRRVDRSP